MVGLKDKLQQLLIHKNNSLFVQFFRSIFVGGFASVVDLAVFYVLAIMLYLHPNLATTISFIFGLLTNYYLSQIWVFHYTPQSRTKSFTLFTVIALVGLGLNNLLLYIMINYHILKDLFKIDNGDTITMLAKIIATFIVFVWNFSARKYFIFRESKTMLVSEPVPESEVNPR